MLIKNIARIINTKYLCKIWIDSEGDFFIVNGILVQEGTVRLGCFSDFKEAINLIDRIAAFYSDDSVVYGENK